MTKSPPVALSKGTPHKSAEKFRELCRPTLINIEDEWLAYDPSGAYVSIPDRDMDAEVTRFLIDAKVSIIEEDQDTHGVRRMHAPFNPKRADIAEVCDALERHCHRPRVDWKPYWMNGTTSPEPHNIIACRNGLLDVATMTLYEHTPSFFTRHALPIDYVPADDRDPLAQPTQFLTFLREAMAGREHLVSLIQEMMGYLLTTDAEQEAVFYLLGKSRGGKGTLMKIIAALVGNNLSTPTIRDFATQYWAWPLREKTVAFVTDMAISDREAVKLAANHINMISGRDPVQMQRKFKEPIDAYTLPSRVVMAGNHMPDFGDHAGALANRLVLIPFDVSFKGREDRALARRIISDELPAIFTWALEGLRRLRERGGFLEPQESIARKRELVGMASPVRTFIDERCVIETGAAVPQGAVYAEFRVWCDAVGIKHVLAKKDFTARLYEEIPGSRESRPRIDGEQVPHYAGLRLRDRRAASPFKFDFEQVVDECLSLGLEPAEAIEMARTERRAAEQHAEP